MIVEDDPVIAKSVADHLTTWQMQVRCAKDFEKIDEEATDFQPDIIIMDIKLPYYNGFYWCSQIRKNSRVPIVFLSSADDNMNIVMAMNMGGDDFISKPFDLQVLTAKLQAVLRRSYGADLTSHTLECGEVCLNLDDTSASVSGKRVELTKNELRILQTLFENKEKIVSRDALMTKLWENDEYVDENTLSVNVNRLRKKLATIGLEDFIVTKKGIGYRIG